VNTKPIGLVSVIRALARGAPLAPKAGACLRLQRAGLGADVMGTGATQRGSEGGGR